MPVNENIENNATIVLNVIDGLDLGVPTEVQKFLAPVYETFPSLSNTIWGIPYANLIAAIVVFFFFLLLRRFFSSVIVVFLQKLAKKTSTYYDDKIISALKGPLGFIFVLIGLHLFFALIFKETETIKHILETLVIYAIFWAILSITEAMRGVVYDITGKFNKDLSKEMGNFILAIIKILIAGVGLGAMLQVWGINVTALVASLGIGGLAFALAAKDTIANLFGSFSLLADRTIRIGEWIVVNNVEGVVEDIGMRTTKIRSFGKSVITVPNHVIANNPIENFSRRGIRRIKMTIGLTYSTTTVQITNIVNDIKTMLQTHEGISHNDTLLVNFESFGDSSLNIFVYTFTNTANWEHYLQIREDINLKIMKIIESHGSSFAFPSQSIYVESMPQT
ncbi:mechanosensitive ion channel family protein [Sulfurovum sp. zt1-1]|uniref:Mechanosensitive ion channel family protein n=1 Tax=Sulfurovum zhangzhouensis TaxID=3019067 RepID=A0ABT7QY45_9BACT|nr:mechanosensitive ion channel family protein [Sulfurovum zhangzhouensis]MDM5271251.1 mechanosensitive ion channel family protein [Sulfurovum zhangzhouensis]